MFISVSRSVELRDRENLSLDFRNTKKKKKKRKRWLEKSFDNNHSVNEKLICYGFLTLYCFPDKIEKCHITIKYLLNDLISKNKVILEQSVQDRLSMTVEKDCKWKMGLALHLHHRFVCLVLVRIIYKDIFFRVYFFLWFLIMDFYTGMLTRVADSSLMIIVVAIKKGIFDMRLTPLSICCNCFKINR